MLNMFNSRRRAALAELLVREGPGRCADVLLSL